MRNEVKPLTGVRGVAAFIVMLYHLHFNPAFAGFYPFFVSKGYLSVDLFFILSGFVLALRYTKDFAGNVSLSKVATFWKHRIGRIYPAYLVISLCDYAIILFHRQIHITAYDMAANLLLVQCWGINATAISRNAWSISTEMFAYILFPILIYGIIRRVTPLGTAVLGLVCTAAIAIVAASHLGVSGPLDVDNKNSFLPLLRCLAEFCLGLGAFKLAQHPRCKNILSRESAIFVVLVGLAALLFVSNSDVAVVLLMTPFIICLFYNGAVAAALFGNRVVYHLGVISYSLYLVHSMSRAFAVFLEEHAHAHHILIPTGIYILLAVALSWGIACLSHRFIEVPGRRILLARKPARREDLVKSQMETVK